MRLSHRYIPARPAARQVGQPARHRRGARRGQPACGAAGGRGLPPAHPGAGDGACDHRAGERDRHRRCRTRGFGARGAGGASRRRWRSWRRAGRPRRRWSTGCSRCARRCARRPRRTAEAPGRRCWRSWRRCRRSLPRPGRDAADLAERGRAGGRRGGATGPASRCGRMVTNEVAGGARAGGHAGPAGDRPGPRAGDDRAPGADRAGRARQSGQAGRRVHAVRPVRRRQDRDGAGAGRGAVWRRAEPDHHQHERVPGGAHRLDAEGRAAGLCRLRRGRRADRGGAAPAVFAWCCWTRSRRRTPMCTRSSSRCSTRA